MAEVKAALTDAAAAFDFVAERYDDKWDTAPGRADELYIRHQLRDILETDKKILDAGCGTGLLLDLVDIPSDRYVGVDVSVGMLERGAEKHPSHDMFFGDITSPHDIGSGFGAYISLFGVWSYVNLVEAIKGMCAALVHKGRFFVMLYSPRHPDCLPCFGVEVPVARWTSEELSSAFRSFDIEDFTIRGFCAGGPREGWPTSVYLSRHYVEAPFLYMWPDFGHYLIIEGAI